MTSKSLFQKLWVIESLPKGDLKTGRNLVDNQLSQAKREHPDLAVAYEQPDTKHELLCVMDKVRDEARSIYPMIHFECHGSPDGLAAADRKLISWDELRTILIEINHACRLNLVIVLAVCNGAHLIKVATRLDRAPFWAVIGPEDEVTAGAVGNDFGAFYTEFFKTLDGDAAISALNQRNTGTNRNYHFFGAARLFLKAYSRYYQEHCSGKGRRERIEDLLTRALIDPAVKRRGVKWARQRVKAGLDNGERHFYENKNRFFFIDCFAENAARFPFSYDDVLAESSGPSEENNFQTEG